MKKEYPFKIAEIVKNNTVEFSHYRAGHLYYTVRFLKMSGDAVQETTTYLFPVPIADTGEATFSVEDKAITFMRYIRLAMEEGTLVKV